MSNNKIENLTHEVSFNVIRELRDRGLDNWFANLDDELQKEVYDSLCGIVIEKVEMYEKEKCEE